MATVTGNTLGALTNENKTFYDRVLLERLLPELVHTEYGQKRSIPKNEGTTIDFRRFNSLAVATTPLAEGTPPAGKDISVTNLTATVAQYGDFVKTTDVIDFAAIDPVVTEMTEVLGEQAGQTIDTLCRDVLAAGTSVLYPGTYTARNEILADDVMTTLLIRKARRVLKRNNVKPLKGGYYVAIVHPDVAHDLMGDTAWVQANQYAGSERIFKGEIGMFAGIRFVESSLAAKWAEAGGGTPAADVYGTLVIGANAYGNVDISGKQKPETIVKQLGSAGTKDPLNQEATVGWKAVYVAVRLEELALLRIETSASA